MKQPFSDLLKNLKPSIADYKYYTDFDKVYRNIEKYKIELNILNSLIGSKDIDSDFVKILKEYPKTIEAIPMLLAVRRKEIAIYDDKHFIISFSPLSDDYDIYVKLMRESGLFDLMENSRIKSLVDYLTGVEVGLDSNARKNRTGRAMENIVESFIKKTNYKEYHKEINKTQIKELYDINLDSYLNLSEDYKVANKRFDFAIKTENHLYIIETNFYSGGGSKLNETARSFKSLASDLELADNVTFIWITDGVGWLSARNNLEETYDVLEHLYTLKDLEEGKLKQIIK